MKKIYTLFCSIVCLCLCMGCGEDRSLEYADRTAVNEWIYATMQDNYLYAGSMKTLTDRGWYATPARFFQSYRVSSESRGGKYISQLYLGPDSSALTYGYEYEFYAFDSINCVRVFYVAPQSPAAEAGLRRGDWIVALNGHKFSNTNYSALSQVNQGAYTVTLGKMLGFSENNKPILQKDKDMWIPAPRPLTANPVEKDTVMDWCGRKVGYLMYTRFIPDPEGGNSIYGAYNDDLRSACAGFSRQGVQEMVLDLRFSSGNAWQCAQLLGTMLTPSSAFSQVFTLIKHTDGMLEPSYLNPSVIGAGANLNLSHLYVIASSRTVGAAELLMHCLTPYMKVVIIGTKTTGNDLLADTYMDDRYGYKLTLATRIMLNATQSTYSAGISPKRAVSEKDSLTTPVLPFGNPQELLLRETLRVMKDSIGGSAI